MSYNVITEEASYLKEGKKLTDIFLNPVSRFLFLKNHPVYFAPLLVSIILTIVGSTFLAFSLNTDDLLKGVSNPNSLSKETQDFIKYITTGAIILGSMFNLIICTFIYSIIYFVFAKFKMLEVELKQLFSMNANVVLITALGTLVNGVICYFTKGDILHLPTSLSGISMLFGIKGNLAVILSKVEIFNIWQFALASIGLQKIAIFTSKYAWFTVILVFIIYLVFSCVSTSQASDISLIRGN
jgi:hypothetical protein